MKITSARQCRINSCHYWQTKHTFRYDTLRMVSLQPATISREYLIVYDELKQAQHAVFKNKHRESDNLELWNCYQGQVSKVTQLLSVRTGLEWPNG